MHEGAQRRRRYGRLARRRTDQDRTPKTGGHAAHKVIAQHVKQRQSGSSCVIEHTFAIHISAILYMDVSPALVSADLVVADLRPALLTIGQFGSNLVPHAQV